MLSDSGLHPLVEVAAHEVPDVVGLGLHDEIAVGDLAFVARRQDQILAALALVGAGRAEVRHVQEPHVVEHPEHALGQLDHGGAVLLEVEEPQGVHRRRVPGQDEPLGVHQRVEDADLVARFGSDRRLTPPQFVDRHRRDGAEQRLVGVDLVQEVVGHFRAALGRHTVEELEGPDGCLHRVRRGDRLRNVGGHLHLGRLRGLGLCRCSCLTFRRPLRCTADGDQTRGHQHPHTRYPGDLPPRLASILVHDRPPCGPVGGALDSVRSDSLCGLC